MEKYLLKKYYTVAKKPSQQPSVQGYGTSSNRGFNIMDRTTTKILLLPLAQDELFNQLYTPLCSQISSKYPTVRKTTIDDAYNFLSSSKPAAVLVADGGLALRKNNHLHRSLVRYARAGGTVIFGCLFSSFVRPSDLGELFGKFDLAWTSGNYHRTTFILNEAVKPVFGEQAYKTLEKSYSMKCLHLKDTPASARVYVPTESSRTESRVFPSGAVDQQQCPAVFHKYGEGFVGYIGDVNNETGSQALTLAMLGMFFLSLPCPWMRSNR